AIGSRAPQAQVAAAPGPHEAREDDERVRWNGVPGGDLVRNQGHLYGEEHQVRPVERREAFPETGAASEVVIRGGQRVLRLEAKAPGPPGVPGVPPPP